MDNTHTNKNIEVKAEKISLSKQTWFRNLMFFTTCLVLVFGFAYFKSVYKTVFIEKSVIKAPLVSLSSSTSGNLMEIYVKAGDTVSANQPIAKVGNEIVVSKLDGIVTSINEQIGQYFSSGATVATMIDPKEEKVIGEIDEDKGLVDIKIGQPVAFTVDAFGYKKFYGVVSEISPMANDTSVVFSISDKRETKKFNVKVSFDTNEYNTLRQGMSAKMTVYTR